MSNGHWSPAGQGETPGGPFVIDKASFGFETHHLHQCWASCCSTSVFCSNQKIKEVVNLGEKVLHQKQKKLNHFGLCLVDIRPLCTPVFFPVFNLTQQNKWGLVCPCIRAWQTCSGFQIASLTPVIIERLNLGIGLGGISGAGPR